LLAAADYSEGVIRAARRAVSGRLCISLDRSALLASDEHSAHDHQDSRRLRELERTIASGPLSPEVNQLIAELIVGWRRYYEPWLVLKAGRHVADAVVSSVELRLLRLLRRKQRFDSPWRSVVWSMVRNELAGERRLLARRGEHETAVGEVFARDSGVEEPSHPLLDEAGGSPEHDAARLRRALVKLSPDDQQLLELLFEHELGRTQAATHLGIRPGTLSVRKHRALARLRAAWDEDEGV
jgi:RNA polymerase sigma factor (sigma-70 family)